MGCLLVGAVVHLNSALSCKKDYQEKLNKKQQQTKENKNNGNQLINEPNHLSICIFICIVGNPRCFSHPLIGLSCTQADSTTSPESEPSHFNSKGFVVPRLEIERGA